MNNLISHLRKLEKQAKHKTSRRKEIIKIEAEINEIEKNNRKNINENNASIKKWETLIKFEIIFDILFYKTFDTVSHTMSSIGEENQS